MLLILVCVGSILACAAQPEPENTLRIGLLAPITGELEYVGQSTIEAATLAIDALNAEGGLAIGNERWRIEIVTADTEDNAEVAVQAARRLINQEQVVALIGPQASRNAIPVARVAEQAQIPMISPWSTNPETTAGKYYVFRAGFIDPFQGAVIARFAIEELGMQKAATLYDVASAYNKGLAEVFIEQFERLGGDVVAAETYTTGTTDFSSHAKVLRESGADVIFLPNYGNEVPLQVRQLRAAGITAEFPGQRLVGDHS
ncbi:MAG: ABC transporter substrate-binding protein [Chloroflexaceae bacterium]|nr:ABC transporter substrate-binding protein [Chloroflexaceae bacterium]